MNDLWRTRLSLRHLIWFLPPPLSRQQVVSLSQSSCLTQGGGEGVEGAKSYDREKAWSSIKHSILSGWLIKMIEAILCHKYLCMSKNLKWRPTPGLINIRRNRYTYWYLISCIPRPGYSVLTMPDSVHSLPGTFRGGVSQC
jgi:hypothetical protein